MAYTHTIKPVISGRRRLVWAALLTAALSALPIVSLMVLGFRADASVLGRIFTVQLPAYLPDTLIVLACVALISGVIGTALAWLVTIYEFPGRGILRWVALLPLTIPGYIVSFVYVDLLAYSGPVQTWLRRVEGWSTPQDYMFPEVRSAAGAGLVLSLVLYPYVYLAAQAAFMRQAQNQFDVARTLGKGSIAAFFSAVLPAALPAIGVGITLALLETLNDVGAAQFFGLQTLTYGVYTLWLGENNLGGAALLAVLLFASVLCLYLIENRFYRIDQRYHAGSKAKPALRKQLNGWRAVAGLAVIAAPIMLGFIVPVAFLLQSLARRFDQVLSPALLLAVGNTLLVAAIVAAVTVALGVLLVYARRVTGSNFVSGALRIGTFGYAIPGTILAIGLLVPLGALDNFIHDVALDWFGSSTGLIFSGSLFAVCLALIIRFITLSFRVTETGAQRITPNIDSAARSLGRTPWQAFLQVHVPLLRPSLAAAAIMVFVDAMKELPATLLLRPFGFDTLATKVFEFASLGQPEDAAVPACIIILAGLIPVVFFARELNGVQSGLDKR